MPYKIILLHSSKPALSSVKLQLMRVNRERAQEVLYTTNCGQAIEEAAKHKKVLIASSNVFGYGGWNGKKVAARIREANSRALFFIWSYDPEVESNHRFVDGFISKDCTDMYQELAEILASINGETTSESLAKDFPLVIKLSKEIQNNIH